MSNKMSNKFNFQQVKDVTLMRETKTKVWRDVSVQTSHQNYMLALDAVISPIEMQIAQVSDLSWTRNW